ncbi:HelD family protein [Bacillota bacterium Meth-B3]
MEIRAHEMEAERARLARTLAIVREQLQTFERAQAGQNTALSESRRELREQAEERPASLWSADGFEALVNLNQYAQAIAVDEKTRAMRAQRAQALAGMLDAPYFARVDFTFDDGGDAEQVYIGRATLRDEGGRDIVVHDWRAPIASVFYRFGVGKARYDAPGGVISGTVTRKRQYEIRRGQLEYFFDADAYVQDRFLREMLSQNASPRMRAIVETIQRDQDEAIRDARHDLLMVQGVAGSGKSSIALHRVAYLMYQNGEKPLSAGDILILSPNALFERYIQRVLPELGEQSVATRTMGWLLSAALGGAPVEGGLERLERVSGGKGAALKASPAFVRALDRFVRELPRRWIPFEDVYYAGRVVATRHQLKARMLAEGDALGLGARLARMERSLWAGIRERRCARMEKLADCARRAGGHTLEIDACARAYSILECAILAQRIRRFTRLDHRALYARLMSDERAVRRLLGDDAPDDLADILAYTRRALAKAVLPLEDAAAIAYLKLLTEGAPPSSRIRQVVVDEAQDLDALQFAVLGRLFPDARFTVLGDVNQALDRPLSRALYDEIARALNRKSVLLVDLNKSFRMTREILQFSLRFLSDPSGIECFNRSGDAPGEHMARSEAGLIDQIAEEIALCRSRGFQSIALIARTALGARAWHARLSGVPEVKLIDAEDAGETAGAFVIPLALSKGLEFDAVLVLDAGRYERAGEKRLLYVACTRALHRLNLYSLDKEGAKA